MQPQRFAQPSTETIRAILDRFEIGNRLLHIREFVWRGGQLDLRADTGRAGEIVNLGYALTAAWPAAVFEQSTNPSSSAGLLQASRPLVEGRWTQGTRGYQLRVGIDLAVPSAIYLRSRGFSSSVPFLRRPAAQVEHALSLEITAYVNAFLDQFRPVPEAAAQARQRLDQLGLTPPRAGLPRMPLQR